MEGSSDVYRLSGKPGPSLIVAPVVGALAGFVLGVIYAYLDVYIPIAGFVTVILTFGFMFGVGWVVAAVGRKFRCRSSMFVGMVGLFAATVALYSSWVAFEFALLTRTRDLTGLSFFTLFLRPDMVWGVAKGFNETGWFTIGSNSPSGVFLWIIWGFEAAVVLIGSPIVAMSQVRGAVFCEPCVKWVAVADEPIRLRPVEPADLDAFFAYQSDPEAWHMVAFAAKEPRDFASFC